MQRCSVPPVRESDECTGAEKVHNVEPRIALLPQSSEKGQNFVCNKPGVFRGNLSALDVLALQTNTKRIDSTERIDRIIESVVDHANQRHLVVEDAAQLFEARLTLIRISSV